MSKGYFWLKFAKPGAIIDNAQPAAKVKTGGAPAQPAGGGGQYTEGYTIRPSVAYGEKQAVATMTFIPKVGTTTMPCALYPMENAAKVDETPYRASKQSEAEAECAKQRFIDWAKDGVPVLIELDLTQYGPDEI